MIEKKLFDDLNIQKKVLNPFKIENRLFFPAVEIISTGNEKSFNFLTIFPFAFLVKESGNEYVIPVTEAEIDENEIFKLFSHIEIR